VETICSFAANLSRENMHGLLAFWLTDVMSRQFWLASPLVWLASAFQIWMLIDAIRRQEWLWVAFIIVFPLVNAVLYFFLVYRAAAPLGQPWHWPGSTDRRRIRELQSQIHHLDKAHHHSQLGDIYRAQGKFEPAEACYRQALERDPEDADTQAHLGQCLLRLGRPQEALPLLERVYQQNPKHDYGYSAMALAEVFQALGKEAESLRAWEWVTDNYSYSRARVELAQLYLRQGKSKLAQSKLQEVIADDVHAPAFERKHERVWVRRARKLLQQQSTANS
jgi:hypothetical protein